MNAEYERAKLVQKEKDSSECSAALLQALKLGEASYEKSLRQQQNLTYGLNVVASKGVKLIKDKSEGVLNRSRYLWSPKSVAYFDRLALIVPKLDSNIGSTFEFMLKLHLMLPINMNIGFADTVFMVPDSRSANGNNAVETLGSEFTRFFSHYSFANQSFYLTKVIIEINYLLSIIYI